MRLSAKIRDVLDGLEDRAWHPSDSRSLNHRWSVDVQAERQVLPKPWIIDGSIPDTYANEPPPAQWLNFDAARSQRAFAERLCQVCGDPLGEYAVILCTNGKDESSGPPCHPWCALIAIRFCPAIQRSWRDGQPIGWIVHIESQWHEMHARFDELLEDEAYTLELVKPEGGLDVHDVEQIRDLARDQLTDE